MGYLISKIIICLLLAFLLGLINGWLLRNQVSRSKEDALIADVEGQMETIEELERDRDDIRRKLQNMERDNVDLNTRILSIASDSNPLLYEQDQHTTDFKHISDLEQIDNDGTTTPNDSLLNVRLNEASPLGYEKDQTIQDLEEVSGEWDPLTTELDQLATSMCGADAEAKSLTLEQTSVDEEQDPFTEKAKRNSEAQNQPASMPTNPPENKQAKQETHFFNDKTSQIDTSDHEDLDNSGSHSIEMAIIEAETDHITELQNQTAPLKTIRSEDFKDTPPLNENTHILETSYSENLDNSLARSGDYDIEEIEGIGKSYAERLRKIRIATTRQLLDKGTHSAIISEIASQVNKKEKIVQSWISMADLIRVPGIRGKFAELLAVSGINSVQQLAKQEGSDLITKIAEINISENRNRTVPTLEMVTVWIAAAKNLPNTITTEGW